jgi:dihydroorotase
MKIAIRGGRLIDPAGLIDADKDVFVDDEGFVVGIGNAPDGFRPDRLIDAAGRIVCPGLVDLRARLREPGQEYKATIESEARAAASAGITTLCCPPDTHPVIDTPAMAQMVQHRAWRFGTAFVHPYGALTQNLEGKQLTDMVALDDAGCVGFCNANTPITDTLVMRRAMEYAASFDFTVFLHSLDPYLQANGCMHEGEMSTRLGLPGIPEAAETVGVARDLMLVEQTGVNAHFCGLSSARAVAMVAEAQKRGLPVTADVAAHHLHLSEHDVGFFDTQCRVLPPLRALADREGLREALRRGVIAAVCSDHQPHEPDAKLAPFAEAAPGISGLETLLPLTLALVTDNLITLPQAIAALTVKPADIIGVDAGHLAIGATADICIFDPKVRWTLTQDQIVSRGRNTPFLGREFTGRVTHTLVGGEVVFERENKKKAS